MKRWLSLVIVLVVAAGLSGCDEDESKGVGQGPGPAKVETKPTDSAASGETPQSRALTLLRDQASAPGAAGGDETLPGGPFFDGSRGQGGSGSAGGVHAYYNPGGSKGSAYKLTASSRSLKAGAGEPPAPGTLPAVVLPKADPSAGAAGGGPVLQAFDAFQRKTYAAFAGVYSRKAWGAASASSASTPHHPSHVTVHHTDGHPRTKLSDSIEEVRGIQSFHMGPERGWADIGYHFVIDGAGRVFEGRHADVLGAHAGGANLDNIGIALMGDYNRDQLSDAQKTTLTRLITFLALRYRTDPKQKGFIQPHMHYSNTDCPGKNVVGFLAELRSQVDGETQTLISGGRPDDAGGSFVPLALVKNG